VEALLGHKLMDTHAIFNLANTSTQGETYDISTSSLKYFMIFEAWEIALYDNQKNIISFEISLKYKIWNMGLKY